MAVADFRVMSFQRFRRRATTVRATPSRPGRWRAGAFAAACLAAPQLAAAAPPDQRQSMAVFVQPGIADRDTRTLTVGVMWPWKRSWPLFDGRLGGYWEIGVGQWYIPVRDGTPSQDITQLSFTPTLRWRPGDGASPWFVEGAIGITLVAPIYRNGNRRFSTKFNFADHLAVGRNFGQRRQHELALRLEHVSNGGIEEPNPGENFLQVRYAWRWR